MMRKFTIGLLIFLTGWFLSRAVYHYLDGSSHPEPVHTIVYTPVKPADPNWSAVVNKAKYKGQDKLSGLLQGNKYETAVAYYEDLKDKPDEAAAAVVRLQILAYARQLIKAQRFDTAGQLLQRYLVAAYRDVDAHLLLAEVYAGNNNVPVAIDQLYEARGYAYAPAKLQRINNRIRSMVAEYVLSLENSGNHNAMLELYQQLTRQEADYAPWFIGLATAQLALDDREAARRSLLLVAKDANVGAKARDMLAELVITMPDVSGEGGEQPLTDDAGIPLFRHGNHFVVAAGQGRNRNIRLLIDTGASMTILRPEVLEQAGLRYYDSGRTAIFRTANGPVQAPVYVFDAFAVGDWQVSQLEAGVLELGGHADIDGLLGMNFLTHFQFYIDQNEARLHLSVK